MSDRTMTDDPFAYGPEWALLERLTLGPDGEAPECDLLERDIAAIGDDHTLAWGELLEQALRHQMLAMLAYHALRARQHGLVIPGRIEHHLVMSLEANRFRLEVFRREAVRLNEAFRAAGIAFVATKGMTFESTIYRGRGVRMLKDIDLMIGEADREAARDVLADLGFTPGNYEWASGAIEPHSRQAHMSYVLNPDHLPRHARLSDEPTVPYLYVDVANSLTWTKSPYEISVEKALEQREEVSLPGREVGTVLGTVPAFDPRHQFLFTVLHLFREAWLEQWVALELDVSLMKFGDVLRLFARDREVLSGGGYVAWLEEEGVAEPVAWVLEHLDRTFGTSIARELGLAGRVDDDWLGAAHASYGEGRRWRGTMRQRLFAKDREELFERLDRDETG